MRSSAASDVYKRQGSTYADGPYYNTGADYAEYMRHDNQGLVAGDVVALDLTNASSVTMAEYGLRNKTVGVVSSKASVVGNVPSDNDSDTPVDETEWVIVGMLGQLPAKFSSVNGSINVGDKLMAGDNG